MCLHYRVVQASIVTIQTTQACELAYDLPAFLRTSFCIWWKASQLVSGLGKNPVSCRSHHQEQIQGEQGAFQIDRYLLC